MPTHEVQAHAEHRLLRSFVAVVESGSFTAAARGLHLTQQAVSAHVARLEVLIGEPLLVRTTRSLRLTENGETLFDEARRALRAMDNVLTRARRRALAALPSYTMGFTPSLSQAAVPAMMSAVPASLELRAVQRWSDELIDGLVDETLDVGLAVAPATHPGIQAAKVGSTRLAMTVRADSVPPGQRTMPLTELIGFSVAMPDRASNPGLHDILANVWQTMDVSLDVVPIPRLLGPSILEIPRRDVCSPWPLVMPFDYVPAGVIALPIEPAIELDITVLARDLRSAAARLVTAAAGSALRAIRDRGVDVTVD